MTRIEIIRDKNLKGIYLTNKKAKELAKKSISKINPKMLNSTIELYFVSKKKIIQINSDFRQITDETDVLSFPQKTFPAAEEKILGTIFISPEVAKIRGENIEELFIHGIVHLLGFDHNKNSNKWRTIIKKLKN